MEPGYALLVCIGCFSPAPLLAGPVVPIGPVLRTTSPENFRTRCFFAESAKAPSEPRQRREPTFPIAPRPGPQWASLSD